MHVYNNLTETLLYFQFNKIKPVESIIFRNVWYSISPPELREKINVHFSFYELYDAKSQGVIHNSS